VIDQLAQCESGVNTSLRPPLPSAGLSLERRQALATVEEEAAIETTAHFIVRSRNAELSRLVAAEAEQALARIAALVMGGSEYPHSVTIEIWPSPSEYPPQLRGLNDADGAVGTFQIAADPSGFMQRTVHLVQRDDDGRFDVTMLDRVLPHELCHLVLSEWFGDAPCPLYVQEGMAMLAEYGGQEARVLRVGTAVAHNKALPVQTLLIRETCPPDELDLFYAQSYCLLAYLQQRLTGGQFAQLLQQMKSGSSLREGLARALLVSDEERLMRQLEQAWQNDTLEQAQILSALQVSLK
jgi:hypothetical protein